MELNGTSRYAKFICNVIAGLPIGCQREALTFSPTNWCTMGHWTELLVDNGRNQGFLKKVGKKQNLAHAISDRFDP